MEKVENYKWLLRRRVNVDQISREASLEQENERLLNWLQSIDQDGGHALI